MEQSLKVEERSCVATMKSIKNPARTRARTHTLFSTYQDLIFFYSFLIFICIEDR
jgi:hypothetical protein